MAHRPTSREAVLAGHRELRNRAAVPGACERAAEFLLADLGARGRKPVAQRRVAVRRSDGRIPVGPTPAPRTADMSDLPSQAVQDYLKAIHGLGGPTRR